MRFFLPIDLTAAQVAAVDTNTPIKLVEGQDPDCGYLYGGKVQCDGVGELVYVESGDRTRVPPQARPKNPVCVLTCHQHTRELITVMPDCLVSFASVLDDDGRDKKLARLIKEHYDNEAKLRGGK